MYNHVCTIPATQGLNEQFQSVRWSVRMIMDLQFLRYQFFVRMSTYDIVRNCLVCKYKKRLSVPPF